ncbi:GTP-binding protein [Trypanosoma rangeli]|uniref:GTP-binding protein n=1 Tax=Trypanosoma rangeli TaxID=5698 RepID=A0A3R7LAS2_TRYRA|nr:GTP-binding protein [Trypanosoma rangeli]RNF10570.1 GTP-binding protein [Trypanosoma rangeli]|eukprot:RNF10570.1 GTP-binding protein [Trypanosoma rangeli]
MRHFCRPFLEKASRHQLPRPVAVAQHPFSFSADDAPVISRREKLVARLSDEVFSKGNVHLKNVNALSALPEGLHSFPEVCFIGKPNVGKSSIVSSLLHNHRLGRSGITRGTTRILQFFNVGDAMLLVDTPGYGGWRGRHLSQGLAERAGAFAVLFRYLALRCRGPLKRVYWVMEARGSLQPRDEELFAFLKGEQIPFSVIMNKIDRFKGDHVALQRQMDRIWNFLGSDQVPVLGVRANPKYPEKCLNIGALQHDITYYCTQELSRAEDLTYKGIRELSYAPPTPEEITTVEQRYPVESFILPQEDSLPLEGLVLAHEEAKAKWLATSPRAGLLSAKDKVANHLVACCEHSCDDDDNNNNTRNGALLSAPALTEGGSEAQSALASATPIAGGSSFVERVETPRRFCVRASLRMTRQQPQQNASETNCWMNTGALTPDAYAAYVLNNIDPRLSPPLSSNTTPLRSFPAPLVPQLSVSLDNETHTVRAINGVPIAKSMITASVANLPASQEGSLEHFSQHSSSGDYNRLLLAELAGQDTFLQEGEHAELFESDTLSLQHFLRKSARRRKLDHILEKYVSRVRKKRSLYVQAEGYMCPWLAGAGQPSRTAVVGSAWEHSSMGSGGALMMGLKRTGFGGKSFSAHTMKNRGRATKKTGPWAT